MNNGLDSAGLPSPGAIIADRYRLRQVLGRGSFGQVYYAEDLKFEPPRAVALKLLHSQYVAEEQVREDLKREASTLARFNHPNILEVLDYGVNEQVAFIVTKLATGGSLAKKLRPDPARPPQRMPLEEVAVYLEQLAEALDEAHAHGLVHRDIKPQNILLDQRGRPLIADFGLVAAVSSASSSSLIDAGTSGTALYMAPEQWRGRAGKASDIYALGVMLYQMITGYPPYVGSQLELMGQHLTNPVPRLSFRAPDLKYPPALDEVIAAALSKDPQARPRPAKELYQRFRAALNGRAQSSSPLTAEVEATIPVVPAAAPEGEATRPFLFGTDQGQAGTSRGKTRGGAKRTVLPLVGGIGLGLVVALVAAIILLGNGNATKDGPASPVAAVTVAQTLTAATSPAPATPTATTLASTPTPQPSFTPVVVNLQTIQNATTEIADPTATPVPSTATPIPPTATPIPPTATPIPPTATPIPPTATSVPRFDTGLQVQAVRTLTGHGDRIISVAFSPDGKILASGSFDNSIRLWDMTTLRELRVLRGHSSGVRSVAFSPDGKTLVSSSNDNLIKFWEVNSGKELATFRGHKAEVSAVAYNPEGTRLVSGSDDTTLKIWDIAAAKELKNLSGHSKEVNAAVFSPDGKTIASAGFDNLVKLWDAESGKELKTFSEHKNQVFSVAFSPNGKLLASSSVDRTIKLWDVEGGQALKTFSGHSDEVPAVAFSPDGKLLVSGGGNADNTVRLWDVESGKEIKSLPGHSSGIRAVAFAPDNKTFASGSRDNTIRIWRINGD